MIMYCMMVGLNYHKKIVSKGVGKMRIFIERDTVIADTTIKGIEFDIADDVVWIQIKDNYVCVDKEDLHMVLKLL